MAYYQNGSSSSPVVFVDLETTGLDRNCHIMQIGAKCGNREFDVYILPRRSIHPQAAAVNGFEVFGNRLFVHGTEVDTVSMYNAANEFLNFLESCGESPVLAAHNAFKFDAIHLVKFFDRVNLYDDLFDMCGGFADTQEILKDWLPYRHSYSLESLVQEFCPNLLNSLHNALDDAIALHKVCRSVGIKNKKIVQYAISLDDIE